MTQPGLAQNVIIPDATLGGEASQVVPFAPLPTVDLILGGATRGPNLFHSFEQFDIGDNNRAYFITPNADVGSIFARITGGDPSQILGVLGIRQGDFSISGADLFLINPNGIIFGQNSALDVGSSFTATTASAVQFGDTGVFNTINPELPPSLISITPSAYFFNHPLIGDININSTRQDLNDGTTLGLRVPNGESLHLLGGNLNILGGETLAGVTALGGRVELGAVGGPGQVEVKTDGFLNFPDTLPRANINLSNAAIVNTILDGSGEINVAAQEVNLSDNSFLLAGVATHESALNDRNGNITINTTGSLQIEEGLIANAIFQGGTGNGGDIVISSESLTISNGSQLTTENFGTGNGGNIYINSSGEVSVNSGSIVSRLNERVSTSALASASAGNILIRAGNFRADDGARINSRGNNNGNAGNIGIYANSIFLGNRTDIDSRGRGSGFPSIVGNSGDITLEANQDIFVLNASINSGMPMGRGEPGDINIASRNLTIEDTFIGSGTQALNSNGGNIRFTVVDDIELRDSNILADVGYGNGSGRAGNIIIYADNLLAQNTNLKANTYTGGSAGSIVLDINNDTLLSLSTLESANDNSEIGGSGASGLIDIQTGNLFLLDGSLLDTSTNGGRDGISLIAGDIEIEVDNIFESQDSAIVSRTEGLANGGNIRISAGSLLMSSGSQISAGTERQGNSGNILVNVDGLTEIRDSSYISNIVEPGATGDGGGILINTHDLALTNGGVIAASVAGEYQRSRNRLVNAGQGIGGNIEIYASGNATFSGISPGLLYSGAYSFDFPVSPLGTPSGVYSELGQGGIGSSGNITMNAENLTLSDGATISTISRGIGDSGNIQIDTADSILLDNGTISTDIDSSAVAQNPSSIIIVSGRIAMINNSRVSTRSDGLGDSGNIQIRLENGRLDIINSNIQTTSARASGGSIFVDSNNIFLREDGNILTSILSGSGSGGNITLLARSFIIALDDSDILAFSSEGSGGNITLQTPGFFGENFTVDSLTADPEGLDGNDRVDINATGAVSGAVTIPNISVIENSLTNLQDTIVDTATLTAGSCIARTNADQGRFVVTGSGGLPVQPGASRISVYPTGSVQSLPNTEPQAVWQPGDPIVEPTGVFPLPNGRLVLAQSCDDN
ncbi:two-partner secretion domain-containing protein [Leptothoe sp. PORK10 BA2]|uniref:two-partner secretion domain-containing protein n=1 Tax=Leptothoe sp. PORK10 BA2 TaxID=3110254 RepID=UPI002B20A311|nr:filamentous hemagglutinin N-terminal domain-containing protein [Leptothoe sp. PORK10 BA2]